MPRKMPDFATLSLHYPGDHINTALLKRRIGGGIDSPDIANTCVVRVSEALNAVGHIIPVRTQAFATRQGSDKRWYGLRVIEFWEYMLKTYGKPLIHQRSPINIADFGGYSGIIGFRRPFSTATGHFTLWNGSRLLYGDDGKYWTYSTEAALWTS